jgi:hypothetical protein
MLSCIAINMTSMEVWSFPEFRAFAEKEQHQALLQFS